MSTRYNDGSHYENHQRAAELQNAGAHAHRTAAEHKGHQDHETGHERSRQDHEHGHQNFMDQQQVHRMESSHHDDAPSHDAIAARAYEIWVSKGSPEGSAEQDWLQALEDLKLRK